MSQHRKPEPCQFCLKPTLNPPRQVPAPMPLSDIWCDDCDERAAREYQEMWESARKVINDPPVKYPMGCLCCKPGCDQPATKAIYFPPFDIDCDSLACDEHLAFFADMKEGTKVEDLKPVIDSSPD